MKHRSSSCACGRVLRVCGQICHQLAALRFKMAWNCPLFSWFAAPTLKGVVRHIGRCHAYDGGFHVTCGVEGSVRTYQNFHSYKKYLYKKHCEIMSDLPLQTPIPEPPAVLPELGDPVLSPVISRQHPELLKNQHYSH